MTVMREGKDCDSLVPWEMNAVPCGPRGLGMGGAGAWRVV